MMEKNFETVKLIQISIQNMMFRMLEKLMTIIAEFLSSKINADFGLRMLL